MVIHFRHTMERGAYMMPEGCSCWPGSQAENQTCSLTLETSAVVVRIVDTHLKIVLQASFVIAIQMSLQTVEAREMVEYMVHLERISMKSS